MSRRDRTRTPRPPLPISPGRERLQQRTRILLAAVLGVALVVAIVAGALLASSTSPKTPARGVTLPPSDRSASSALLAAAEAVGFIPNVEPGVGQIEGKPASAGRPASTDLLPAGSVAPAFTLRTPEGVPVSLSSFRGKAVLLEFFATWCPHCDAEAPHLEQLYRALPHGRVAFVAVNADGETAPSVLAFHIYFGMGYPALLDPSSHPGSFHAQGSGGRVTTAYRVASYPTFYVIDPHGKIAWAGDGEQPDALLREQLLRAAAS
jgi:cytochrome c biogenesis protein CcmG, thiol:disulfide interchange protein DsbE